MRYLGFLAMKEGMEEVRLFSFQDMTWLFHRKKKWIIRCGWLGVLIAMLLILANGSKYTIEASFKEQKEETAGNADLLKSLFTGSLRSASPKVDSFMKSLTVLRPVIEKNGLQAQVVQETIFSTLRRRVFEMIRAERQKPLTELDCFRFRNVTYEGEPKIYLGLRFFNAEEFEVLDGKDSLAIGTLGKEVQLNNFSFTIDKTPKKLRLKKTYSMKFTPWISVAKLLRKQLCIVPHKNNPAIYDLTYLTRDRSQGMALINSLMWEFQKYLKKEHDEFAEDQLAYLSKRQGDLFLQLTSALKDHAARMSRNLGEKGFMDIAQELQVFVEPHCKMMAQLFTIDLDLQRLKEGGGLTENSPFSRLLQSKYEIIQTLQQQRDLLELSVSQSIPVFKECGEPLHHELDEIRKKKNQAQTLLSQLSEGKEFVFDADAMIASWAQRMQQSETPQQERKDFSDYLSNWVRLLSVREKILSERFLHKGSIPPEFEGIDLETSRALYVSYNNRLDQAEASMHSIASLKKQIESNDFELGSLGSVLRDPMSQQLIASAGALYFQLKNEKYCSSKEGERWSEELGLQRTLLGEHLQQLYRVEQLNATLVREKLSALQQVELDCIHRQISVIQEQIEDGIAKRRVELLQEKKLLEEKIQDMRLHLAHLPEKWHEEKLFELKSKANQNVMKTIVELVEAKTIGHHLHRIGSKPLDLATLPLLPNSPLLCISLFLGAVVGGFGSFFVLLMKELLKGFPMNAEKLKILKLPFSGSISFSCDGPAVELISGNDLDSIRQICLFADAKPSAQVLGLLAGQGPDFSYALAETAGRMGRNICLLRCDFSETFQPSDCPGLLQILEGTLAEAPMRKGKGFDYLPAGGYSQFGAELIQSVQFSGLIHQLKNRYDLIFLYFRSPLHFAESKVALKICDKVVVSIRGESIDLLTPFASWAYYEGNFRLTFIASDVV
jgi:hypothetical protein